MADTANDTANAAANSAKPGAGLPGNAGLWAILGGVVVLALVAGFAIVRYSAANDAANVIAAVGTVLGALVGAFFGVHIGASAGAQAQQDALNKVQATHQQAMDSLQQNNNQLVQAAVAMQPGSDAANQFLATLK
jgi:uncharacterized membrane protein